MSSDRYRVLATTYTQFGQTELDTIVKWEGVDTDQLSRQYPPSNVWGADPLSQRDIEDGFIITRYRFERQLPTGIWETIDDPRRRITPVTSLERAIDAENRRLFPGDYIDDDDYYNCCDGRGCYSCDPQTSYCSSCQDYGCAECDPDWCKNCDNTGCTECDPGYVKYCLDCSYELITNKSSDYCSDCKRYRSREVPLMCKTDNCRELAADDSDYCPFCTFARREDKSYGTFRRFFVLLGRSLKSCKVW